MKILAGLLLAVLANGAALAGSTLVTNPYLPYPPACARIPDLHNPGGIESQAVKFHEEMLNDGALTLRAFRAPCSEPNRSLIWLEFTLSAQHAREDAEIWLPTVAAEPAPLLRTPMSLAIEPNGWGSEGWVDRESVYLISHVEGLNWYYDSPEGDRKWVFLLDNAPPFPGVFEFSGGMGPEEYNSDFKLVLRYNPYDFLTIEVPATKDILPPAAPDMPLSGRLSGNWVVADTADQGLLLSISEKVLPDTPGFTNRADMPMVIFLAHYTFDPNGDMLWLTGAADFDPGQTHVTIPIELVTNGQFRGSQAADRETVGSVTLRSHSCNDLGFEYDYSGIGLGSGERRLERLFSLEIAGHDCRDYEARVAAND